MADNKVWGKVPCNACATESLLKENKNGNLYYFCPLCKHKEQWAKENSTKMKNAILENEQGIEANEPIESKRAVETEQNTGIEAQQQPTTTTESNTASTESSEWPRFD